MLIKALIIAAVVAAIAFFTFPYWASCNMKYDACLTIWNDSTACATTRKQSC